MYVKLKLTYLEAKVVLLTLRNKKLENELLKQR